MENIEQENNYLEGANPTILLEQSAELQHVVQLTPPKEVFTEIAELERKYNETVARENV